MKSNNKRLLIKQIDKKMKQVESLDKLQFNKDGWVRTIRQLLNISLEQLGKKIGVSAQAIKGIENREQEGTVTMKSLAEIANVLDMKLVYGFLPKDSSLEKMIERKANEVARKIVLRSSTTMKLEDQENSSERIKEAIDELTEELKREMPGTLWD